eukprot:Colp12_sorted_trinity150504_noHs@23063
MDPSGILAGVLTVSDSCFQGTAVDTSGPNLKEILLKSNLNVASVVNELVPDDKDKIVAVIKRWVDEQGIHLVLTTGGTGFAATDVTPEAVKSLIEKEAPGLTICMLTKSLEVTPLAMLSRPVCGVRKSSLIATLPGSKKGSTECLDFLMPALPHAIDLLTNKTL